MTEKAVLVEWNTIVQHISRMDLQAMVRLMGTDHEDVGCDCSRKQPRTFPISDVEAKYQYLELLQSRAVRRGTVGRGLSASKLRVLLPLSGDRDWWD